MERLRIPAAFFVLCAFLSCVALTGGAETLSEAFAVGTLLFGGWLFIGTVAYRRASRYDLDLLRELHETGGPAPVEEEGEVADDAGILCPCCGNVYAAWLLVCPECKRSGSGRSC